MTHNGYAMLSRENPVSAADTEKKHRWCALRTVGRAGSTVAGSRQCSALRDSVLHCSSIARTSRRAATRKPAVHRTRPESALQKDAQFGRLTMALSSDHTYLTKPNHRRSSLPMDYRWLAGMTPKWYANVRKRRSVSNLRATTVVEKQLEMADVDDAVTVQNITSTSPSEVTCCTESRLYDKTVSLVTTHDSDSGRAAGIHSCQYSVEKFISSESETVLKPFDQSTGQCNTGECYVLESHFLDRSRTVILQAPLAPVLISKCNEAVLIIDEGRQTNTVKQHTDKQIVGGITHCDADGAERDSEDGVQMLSDTHKRARCCSSGCDRFCFCDSSSLSVECQTDVAQRNKTDAGYVGCDGSRKVTCDLRLVGAIETVSDGTDLATDVTDGQSVLAAENREHEDFVDNICIDCGCELSYDDMTKCAYSVPICSICSLDAEDNVASVDDITLADHCYASPSTGHLVCPSPLKETTSSPPAVCQQPEVPDTDIVDDITFLSFPSKLLMHKYISNQQNVCDPAAKSSWMELARCERSWHAGHKSHRRVWFGSMRHRHIDRFSAHNRLNEQIELGLVKPASALNSADMLGISLQTSVSPQSTSKTTVGKKLKCGSRNVAGDLRIQRPTRVAARGQHYCLTRHWHRGNNAMRAGADAERVLLTKLTQQQADETLKPLHVPPVITRNDCSLPGIYIVFVFFSFVC